MKHQPSIFLEDNGDGLKLVFSMIRFHILQYFVDHLEDRIVSRWVKPEKEGDDYTII